MDIPVLWALEIDVCDRGESIVSIDEARGDDVADDIDWRRFDFDFNKIFFQDFNFFFKLNQKIMYGIFKFTC